MFYRLSKAQEDFLISEPETGMGYQVIEAIKTGSYVREEYLVLNSEIVIEMDGHLTENVSEVFDNGIFSVKTNARLITFSQIWVLSERQVRYNVNEPKNEKGATENPVENADGKEVFVRLSAFEEEKRVDKINKCLRPGSYTTTEDYYVTCKFMECDPIQRYALPTNNEIISAFHFKPVKTDTLQKGIVQPAYGKQGGGKEAFFAKGTAINTFLKQTPY